MVFSDKIKLFDRLLEFLARSDLKGMEVPEFIEICTEINNIKISLLKDGKYTIKLVGGSNG